MIVVSDSTPLIGLASIERLELLRQLFGQVYIPQAVHDEVIAGGPVKDEAKREVLDAQWIRTAKAQDRLAVQVLLDELDLGEAEAIVLASEMKADWVLMDERKGRRKLSQLNLNTIGTLGILLKAKEAGLVASVRPELDRLQQTRFKMSRMVLDQVLKRAGE